MFIEMGSEAFINIDQLQYLCLKKDYNNYNDYCLIAVVNNATYQLNGAKSDIYAEYKRINELLKARNKIIQ